MIYVLRKTENKALVLGNINYLDIKTMTLHSRKKNCDIPDAQRERNNKGVFCQRCQYYFYFFVCRPYVSFYRHPYVVLNVAGLKDK